MAKMTKRQLKLIVKECLVEILSEGLNPSESSMFSKQAPNSRRKKSIRLEEERLRQHRQKFETSVDDAVMNVTEDPMMQSILADTAKITLQEQIQHEGPSSPASSLVSGTGPTGPGINLDDLFSGPQLNWQDLAFDDNKSS